MNLNNHKNSKYLKFYLPDIPNTSEQVVVTKPINSSSGGKTGFLGIEESSSVEEIDLNYIIRECPPTKLVREFFKENLNCVLDEEEELFNKNFS